MREVKRVTDQPSLAEGDESLLTAVSESCVSDEKFSYNTRKKEKGQKSTPRAYRNL